MRKADDGGKRKKRKKRKKKAKNGENSGPLTSLPVDRLNSDRLQHRPLLPMHKSAYRVAPQLKDTHERGCPWLWLPIRFQCFSYWTIDPGWRSWKVKYQLLQLKIGFILLKIVIQVGRALWIKWISHNVKKWGIDILLVKGKPIWIWLTYGCRKSQPLNI